MNIYLQTLLTSKVMKTSKLEEKQANMAKQVERYHAIENGAKLKEFRELEQLVGTDEFQTKKRKAQKTKYAATDESKMMARLKDLEKNKDVKKYLDNPNGQDASMLSSAVRNYLEVKEQTSTREFQERNAYWQDKKRWENSEEGKKEARMLELKKDEDILFYLGIDKKEVERFDTNEMVYQDEFNWMSLQNSDWKSGYAYPNEAFQGNHSYVELNFANAKGKNVSTQDSILTIATKKESVSAPAWDAQKGMVQKDFGYTADTINNADKLALQQGDTLQIKVRMKGKAGQSIFLSDKMHQNLMYVLKCVNGKNTCGIQTTSTSDIKTLRELSLRHDFIYTISWQQNEVVWYVNNKEMYRTRNVMNHGEKLYLHLSSFLGKKQKAEGQMMVDWVKVYRKK